MSNDSILLDTFSLSFPYPSSIIQSMSFCLGLLLPILSSILPSIISLYRELPLRMYPIQFFCLVQIIFIKDTFSSTFFNTFSNRTNEEVLKKVEEKKIL